MTTLETKELAFGYPGHPVGADANLRLAPGEVICLLGPNGSGKTTLFKTMLGLIPRQGGTVQLDGRDLDGLSRQDVARLIAYVPQAHAHVFPYTVRDIVLMGRTAHRGLFASPGRPDRDRVETVLRQLRIEDLGDQDYTRISGGQRQLAMIARALAQDTRLIVMDEPTASLDYGNQIVVLEQVRALAATGYGIILSTHNPDHAFLLATRVLMLHDGRIEASGTPDDVLTRERLSRTYGVGISVETLSDGRKVCVAAALDAPNAGERISRRRE